MRKVLAASAALALPFALSAAPATAAGQDDGGQTYVAQLDPLNKSGSSGTATVEVMEGNRLHVTVNSTGLVADAPHAQHIHYGGEARHECPTTAEDDADGDGFISTPEGQPAYGGIQVSLTTEGDVSPASGLAVERFPVGATVSYERTFDVPSGFDVSDLQDAVIVQHGIDVNGNGTYDMDALGASDLDTSLPAEATHPTNCGALRVAGAGGMDTGAGGTDGIEDAGLLGAGAVGILAAGALVLAARRRTASE